jgi:tryptophan-rich sensory protein
MKTKQSLTYFLILTTFAYSVIQFSAQILGEGNIEAMAYNVGVMIVCLLALRGNDD